MYSFVLENVRLISQLPIYNKTKVQIEKSDTVIPIIKIEIHITELNSIYGFKSQGESKVVNLFKCY